MLLNNLSMLFPTLDFGIFFLFVFFGSWCLKKYPLWDRLFLIAASYFFYGYWDWHFVFLLFGCTLFNYLLALLIQRADQAGARAESHTTGARLLLAFSVVVNLGVLAFFKYYYFLTINLNNVFLFFGIPFKLPLFFVTLPVGISFFTFQAMSYTIDVYRHKLQAQRSLINILLYISFFPQLVAGPIVRATDFLPQLNRNPSLKEINFGRAFTLISFGLIKKVFIANYLGIMLVDPVFNNPSAYSGLELLAGLYGYAVQIFCDFSAYSDIAIGVALLFGFDFPPNFKNPYCALSIQDFWRRWHISLSTWLKDYLYIPLGGNRHGRLASYRNLFLTMLLGGLWHGADWKFVIWGGLHGLGLSAERLVRELRPLHVISNKDRPLWLKVLRFIFTFHFVGLGWIFFRAPSLELAWEYLCGIFSQGGSLQIFNPFLLSLILIGLVIHFIPENWQSGLEKILGRLPVPILATAFGLLLILLSAVSTSEVAPFIYFQF